VSGERCALYIGIDGAQADKASAAAKAAAGTWDLNKVTDSFYCCRRRLIGKESADFRLID